MAITDLVYCRVYFGITYMYVVEECKGINFLYVLTSIPALEEKIFHNFSYLEIT